MMTENYAGISCKIMNKASGIPGEFYGFRITQAIIKNKSAYSYIINYINY
jgi:hypothetical protein